MFPGLRIRLNILRAEAKLFALLLASLVFLSPLALILLVELPLYLVFLRYLEGGFYFKPIGIYVSLILVAVIIRKKQLGSDMPSCDEPLKRPLDSDPAFHELVKSVASRIHAATPQCALLSISPAAWHRLGVDLHRARHLARGIPLPVSCLETWSISEMEAHVARAIICHRGPAWLFTAIDSSIESLRAEQYQRGTRLSSTNWMFRAQERTLQKCMDTVAVWRLLVELEADVRVVGAVGTDAVISLAYKTELANGLVPEFIANVVEPALDTHTLPPLAESYAAFASAVDPHWKEALSKALREMDSSDTVGVLPVTRLAVLSSLPTGIAQQDPRPALSLFTNLRQLEREIAINEFGRQRIELATTLEISDWAHLAVIPQLIDEVDRNFEILEGKTRFDIPELLLRKIDLATMYESDHKYLFARIQKQQRIPYLLGAFLAVRLIDEQWTVSYAFGDGIQLGSGPRQIQPFELVKQLDEKVISTAEFLEAVK